MVSGARILIVDDEPDICEEFAEYLEARGHHVDTAATVGAAHALLATGRPYSMVLTDFRLGNGRGTDVAIAARLALGNRALIVVITGQLTAETELAVREAGADQAMAKPIDPLALLALIATMPAL
jgi:DNA-binding response OmpR family regulator